MQFVDQPGALVAVDHEAEIEVIGSLRHQVNALFLEDLERRRQARQDRTDLAADQADGRAVTDELHVTHLFEVLNQKFGRFGGQHSVPGINRYRDVRFRRGHEIHGNTVPCKYLESLREEADLIPHPYRGHRDQGQPVANTDTFHPRLDFVGDCRNDGAGDFRVDRAANEYRYLAVAGRRYAARMQYLAAGRRKLLRFVVMQRNDQPRRRHDTRVGREHARYVGPDFEPSCLQLGRHVGGRRVGAAATEQHSIAVRITRDESLGNHDATLLFELGLEGRVRLIVAGRRKISACRIRRRPQAACQQIAGVGPASWQTTLFQVRRAERCRHQLAECHHAHSHPNTHLLANQAHAGNELLEFVHALFEELGAIEPQLPRQIEVLEANLLESRSRIRSHGLVEDLDQRVRHAAQRRVDDNRAQPFIEP